MKIFSFILSSLSIFITVSLLFIPFGIIHTFGDIELESIIFHIFMPQKDMSLDWLKEMSIFITLTSILSILLIICSFKFLRIKKYFYGVMLGFLFFDFYYVNKHFSVFDCIYNQFTASRFIKDNYVSPLKVIPPHMDRKRQNLIIIQVESLETSFQDKENGGLLDINYIPELTQLAKENTSFSSSDLISGAVVLPETGWTMGGVVAETAGIPLKSYKIHKNNDQIGNRFNKYVSFLDGVVSLGDILNSYGYDNYFILGSSKSFAGQDVYFKKHGNYKIFDHNYIRKNMRVEKPQKNWWGLLDKDVFEFSKKKITEISKKDKPFSIFIQTIDSHRDGFLSPDCPQKYNKFVKNVYACVSFHLNDFILWIKGQEFFQDTTIVIVGDHCNMNNTLFSKNISNETGYYEGTERRIYNTFINPVIKPVQEKNRSFSTMDMFPTILAALGVKIKGERLGLGTNLFSDRRTLLEEYGYQYLYQELRKKSHFYNKKLLYPQ